MGQEEGFHSNQSNNDRVLSNIKYIKSNNYIDISQSKAAFHPTRSMFEFLYVIGRGGFGKVWTVKYKKSQQKYALKEMSKVKKV